MLKNPLISTIKKIIPATVTIVISKNSKEIRREVLKNLPLSLLPKGRNFKIPKEEINKDGMVQVGGGSGFMVDSDGIIVSNRHVIADLSSKYTVITNDGKKFDASVVARDPISDIAILKIINRNKFPFLKFGNSSKLELGETVVAVGNALGIFQNTVSSGIISGLSRSIAAQIDRKSPVQEIHGLIQTDAAINPGNSGGPLVNLKGEVIGINVAIISGAQNIGFAIPINSVQRDLDDIKKYGRIRRPFLGIHYLIIDENTKDKFNLPVDYGALVISEKPYSLSVIPESPAHYAGLKEKDIILECNGQKISQEKTIGDILENCSADDNLKLKVLRKTKEFETKIILGERK